MIIDVHSHFFPREFLDEVGRAGSRFRVETDDEGNPVLHSPGDYKVAVPGHRDAAYRARVLDDLGVTMQVLSLTAPGTSIETPERAAEVAPRVNDGLARIVAADPAHFTALAHLPLNHPAAAAAELSRATRELGMPGAMLYSNAAGVALADERFWPLYEFADAHSLVLYIHPTYPLGVAAMESYMLMPLVGFLMDTTLAAAHLVFSGVAARFPGIRWVLGHLGGAIPYLAERLDRGFEAFPACRENLQEPPSTHLRRFYYDTVNFDPRALGLALDFAGADHLLAGSDYPHMIGSLEKMLGSIRSLGLPAAEEAKVLGGNAARLFRVAALR
jgi:aminocarboxymuconate-semialdehyde decarboxylase